MQQDHVSSLPLPPLIQDEEDSLVQPVPQQRTSADTDVISSHITEASSDLDTSLQPVPPSVEAPILTRRSTRAHKVPSHLQDYICSQVQSSWCNLVVLPPEHTACISAIDDFPEPSSYEQAVKHPGWVEATDKEFLHSKQTILRK